MRLLVSSSGQATINVNKNDGKIYLEIFKPIGKKAVDLGNKTKEVPVFLKKEANGDITKNSKTGKLSIAEISTLIKGLEVFVEKGAPGFHQFAQYINNNEKFKNLIFAHESRNIGLQVTQNPKEANSPVYIGFTAYESGATDTASRYSVGTASKVECLGIIAKLQSIRDVAINFEMNPSLKIDKKTQTKGKSANVDDDTYYEHEFDNTQGL
jgi:hypothetical protein